MKPTIQKAASALSCFGFLFLANHGYSQTNTFPTSGNVGIGTGTAPSAKLQVNGSARIDSTLTVQDSMIVDRDAHIRSDLRVDGNTILGGNLTLSSLRDSTLTDDEVILIDSTGNLKRGGDLKSVVYSESVHVPCKDENGGNTTPALPTWLNGPGKIYTSNQCVPDVKVGIGKNSPEAKLHIQLNPAKATNPIMVEDGNGFKLLQLNKNGTLLSRKVRVDMQNWADYVFLDDYVLMDLDSLAQFIAQNKHLPNIPTTDSVVAEGVDLGEMNRLLLQKVEELTLYILQERQKNQELEDRLKRLEEKLTK